MSPIGATAKRGDTILQIVQNNLLTKQKNIEKLTGMDISKLLYPGATFVIGNQVFTVMPDNWRPSDRIAHSGHHHLTVSLKDNYGAEFHWRRERVMKCLKAEAFA